MHSWRPAQAFQGGPEAGVLAESLLEALLHLERPRITLKQPSSADYNKVTIYLTESEYL